MTSFIEQLLAEAESELTKEANDANGAPDNASQQEQGGGDINTTAQAFLQKVEQFKAQLGQNVAGAEQQQQDPNAPVDPNAEAPVDLVGKKTPNGRRSQTRLWLLWRLAD